MSIRLYLLFPLAVALASLHALPFVPWPDRVFGVAVPREIRYGNEGRQALRRYELHLLPWTAAALVVSLGLPLSWAVLWVEAAFLIPLAAAGWVFSRRRIEIRHFALPAPSTREARLTDADDRLLRQFLLFAIPLAYWPGQRSTFVSTGMRSRIVSPCIGERMGLPTAGPRAVLRVSTVRCFWVPAWSCSSR